MNVLTPYFLGLLLLIISNLAFAYERIVSINLCSDVLVHALQGEEGISSLSYFASDPSYSPIYDLVQSIHINHALVEEIIPLQPDLVLAGKYSNTHAIFFLRHLGLQVQQVDTPFSVDGIEKTIIELGETLGKTQQAAALVADMRQRKKAVQDKVQGKRRPLVVTLAPSGFTHGKHSMQGDLIEMAGYENLSATVGIIGSGYIDLETLIKYQPEYIIMQYESENHNSLAQRFLMHPALRQALPNTQAIEIPSRLWACASPYMIDALEILANAHPEL